MNPLTALLYTVRFLLELALLTALGVIGWNLADAMWLQVILALAVPAATASLWVMVVAPKARLSVPLAGRLLVELVIFAAATLGLWSLQYEAAALLLMGLEVLVLGAMLATGNPPGPSQRPDFQRPKDAQATD